MVNRRNFLKKTVLGTGSLLVPWQVSASLLSEQAERISLGLCADVHKDIMPDADQRLQTFVDRMNELKPDVVIQMGDFCFPKPENLPFLNIWKQYQGRSYHMLGNHDMDTSSKKETMEWWGMEKNYYHFDSGAFRFFVLDPNYLKLDGAFVDYEKGNFYQHAESRTYVPNEQLKWLEEELKLSNRHCFIFSHQSLENEEGVKNQEQIRALLERINEESEMQKVVACFSGHHHIDYHKEINGIHYFQINSMSYQWLGKAYAYEGRYDSTLYDKYPSLPKVAPYRDALYAVLSLSPEGIIQIRGIESEFIQPDPWALGYPRQAEGHQLSARISDRRLRF